MLSPRSRFIKNASVSPLEERIGYKFRNSLLLAEALTHPSLSHETQRYHFDNQRLEFLGDAVLQLVITEHLFRRFGGEAEGQLTKLRSRLVSRETLKMHAAALDLGRYLLMGRGEEASGGRERMSTLADAFEALIGAIYLDGGLDTARTFILVQARADLEQKWTGARKTFVVQVVWEGIVLGQGRGRSKKQAETAAALDAMQLKRWENKPKPAA